MPYRKQANKTKTHFRPVLVDRSEDRHILDFRPLGFRDIAVLGRYQYAEARPALQLHNHGKMVEICYLESGRQTYCVGDEEFHLAGGDLFVTFPYECHGSNRAPQGKGVLYWLLINVPNRHERLLGLTEAETLAVFERLLRLSVRQFPGGDGMGRILRRVINVFEHDDDPLHLAKLRTLLLGFLLSVLDASQNAQRRVSPAIQQVQQMIAENLDKELPIRQLARAAHLSDSRLKARFKAEVGVPPADYTMRQRIDRAKQYLRQTDLPVTDIAFRLGFSSTQYFATVFRRYAAQTPSGYRRQLATP